MVKIVSNFFSTRKTKSRYNIIPPDLFPTSFSFGSLTKSKIPHPLLQIYFNSFVSCIRLLTDVVKTRIRLLPPTRCPLLMTALLKLSLPSHLKNSQRLKFLLYPRLSLISILTNSIVSFSNPTNSYSKFLCWLLHASLGILSIFVLSYLYSPIRPIASPFKENFWKLIPL